MPSSLWLTARPQTGISSKVLSVMQSSPNVLNSNKPKPMNEIQQHLAKETEAAAMILDNGSLSNQSEPRYSSVIGRSIDNTALAMYMTCPRKYLYGMVLNRRNDGAPSPALSYGSAWHKALETSYKAEPMSRDELYDRVELEVAESWQQSTNPDDYRTFQRCMVEYDKYLNKYGLPWEERERTVGWPDRPLVEIAIEAQIPGARHPYVGKIDRVIEAEGQFIVDDHKTASMFRSDYFRQWELDNQMIGYATIAGIITGLPIAGVRIDLHVIRKSDSVFERQTIRFSQQRLDHWKQNYDYWLERIETEMDKWNDPGKSAWDAFPHNFAACSTKYGMCQYAGVCSMPPRLRQATLEADFEEIPWNPLETSEEGASDV